MSDLFAIEYFIHVASSYMVCFSAIIGLFIWIIIKYRMYKKVIKDFKNMEVSASDMDKV